MDGRKRKYFLIEGQTDTPFRVYRESAPKSAAPTWWSVAGTLPELHAVEQTLREDKSQAAKRLADRMVAAIPTLEATEEVRGRAFDDCARMLTQARNANVRSTAKLKGRSLSDLNLASHCTRVVLEARG